MLSVNSILRNKTKPFNTISPDTLVFDALQLLNTIDLSYLVVMQNDEFQGIFSERDYTRNVILKGRASRDTIVGDVMTIALPRVEITDSVEHCMNLMTSRGTRYLVAFNNDQFLGIITIHDLLRHVIANREMVFDHSITEKLLDSDEGSKFY